MCFVSWAGWMEEHPLLVVSSGVAVAPFHPNWGHTRSRTAGALPPCPCPVPVSSPRVLCSLCPNCPLQDFLQHMALSSHEKLPPANPSPRRRLPLALFPFPFPVVGCVALIKVWHCCFAHPSGRGDVFITFPGDYLFKHSLTVTITRAARCVSQQKDTRC